LSGLSLGSLLFGLELSRHESKGTFSIFLIAICLLFGIASLRHARKHPSPIMDFALMKVPSFGTAVIAGATTRITQGAQHFRLQLIGKSGVGL
ncbi:MFS transporter, partial [Rhizobium johnstonii]